MDKRAAVRPILSPDEIDERAEMLQAESRMIAADMLAALKAIADDVRSYGLLHPELGGMFMPESLETADAAIAKAEGRDNA